MIPLARISEGEEVKVYCVNCGRGLRKRFCDLGLYDGTMVKVIKNDVVGPMILEIKGYKLAIGRGQAQKIMVDKK